MNGIWGSPKRSKRIHYYPEGLHSICGLGGAPFRVAEQWDEDDEITCPSCKNMFYWMRKGVYPVSNS